MSVIPDQAMPDDDMWAAELTTRNGAAPNTRQTSEEFFESCVTALMAEFYDTDGLDLIPTLEPLIDDVLYLDTVARICGASGTFKSFMTLDMAGCVGTGTPWHGQRVRQGPVLYMVAEGIKGVRRRVRAWEQHHGRKMTGVRFLPRPVQAMDPEWEVLAEVCRRTRPSLVIIDTQARITVGIEENSNTEMGRVVDRMEHLRAVSGACVLLVHHTGNDSVRGRGASAVKGALQTELGVERTGKGLLNTQITLTTGKQKDDEELSDITFGIHQVAIDGEAKENGDPITSVVLVPLDPTQTTAHNSSPDRVEELVAALDAAAVKTDWGRRKVRDKITELGIQARNEDIDDAIKRRRNRANHPANVSPNVPMCPEGMGTA